jgi:CelD/BcsL family acetyltransferase involved in cellulose biosynthesis
MSTSTLPAASARRPAARTPEAPLLAQALTDVAALQRLRPEWEALWWQARAATPFQSPQWLLPWWQHVGQGRLASVALRCPESGTLVGFAPLYVYRHAESGQRHLFPLGIATSDDHDVLTRPGDEARVLQALLAHLREQGDAFDVFDLPQLRSEAFVLRLAAPPGWRLSIADDDAHPVLAWETAPAIAQALAANLRTCRNRAARAGSLQFETADAASLPAMLEALFALHTARWSERAQAGVLADAAVRAWHRAAAPQLLAAGMLRLQGLRLDGEWIALAHVLADPAPAHARRSRYYIGGFDPRQAALSPGALLIHHAIASAHDEGARAFDFLRGAEPYKYRWGAVDEPRRVLRLWPR